MRIASLCINSTLYSIHEKHSTLYTSPIFCFSSSSAVRGGYKHLLNNISFFLPKQNHQLDFTFTFNFRYIIDFPSLFLATVISLRVCLLNSISCLLSNCRLVAIYFFLSPFYTDRCKRGSMLQRCNIHVLCNTGADWV